MKYGFQPGGSGTVTVRSVSLSGATGAPVTLFCSNHVEIEMGFSASGAVADVDVVVVQMDL